MSIAALIIGHLNAPYGQLITEEDVWESFRKGTLSARSDNANAILSAMFCEMEPVVIIRCALEAKARGSSQQTLFGNTNLWRDAFPSLGARRGEAFMSFVSQLEIDAFECVDGD